jgi:hypothetical protein
MALELITQQIYYDVITYDEGQDGMVTHLTFCPKDFFDEHGHMMDDQSAAQWAYDVVDELNLGLETMEFVYELTIPETEAKALLEADPRFVQSDAWNSFIAACGHEA